jgi:GntR family transcriptional regulator, rspAB operon transcriptional repressor
MNNENRRTPATERVLAHILEEMDEGKLYPGGRINASQIASRLELSIAPVREALCVLAGRGVVDLHTDRGATVRSLTAQDVQLIWELLAALGGVGLRLAARAMSRGAQADTLQRCFDKIVREANTTTPVEFISNFSAWHYEANVIGGNEFVNVALDRIGVPYWDRYLVQFFDVDANRDRYVSTYRRLHDAILCGDGEAAFATFQFHAEWSVKMIGEYEVLHAKRKRRRKA